MKATIERVALTGLPGCKTRLMAIPVVSVTGAIKAIRNEMAITSAGDTGALNVWRDDRHKLRGEFYQHRETVDAQTFETVASAARWIRETWPKLGR